MDTIDRNNPLGYLLLEERNEFSLVHKREHSEGNFFDVFHSFKWLSNVNNIRCGNEKFVEVVKSRIRYRE